MTESISIAMAIGRQVRATLAEYGKSQSELAAAIGVTGTHLSRRMTGRVPFRGDELVQIAEYLGVDPGRFLQPIPEPRSHDPSAELPRPTVVGSRGAA